MNVSLRLHIGFLHFTMAQIFGFGPSGTHTYTGGHRAGDTLRILSDNNFLRAFALILPDFAALAKPKPPLKPNFFKTRFCPLGHFVTDFGHGAGNGTGGRIGFPSQ